MLMLMFMLMLMLVLMLVLLGSLLVLLVELFRGFAIVVFVIVLGIAQGVPDIVLDEFVLFLRAAARQAAVRTEARRAKVTGSHSPVRRDPAWKRCCALSWPLPQMKHTRVSLALMMGPRALPPQCLPLRSVMSELSS